MHFLKFGGYLLPDETTHGRRQAVAGPKKNQANNNVV